MGMRKREIDAKFDAIVAFSEVERFLDTPLKYYSSGMMVRLGFAVAAHINPDVLLVDEVLAVGDTAFQAKCLNKIAELKEMERTIILVSHTMPSILQHSSRVLWIDHGKVQGFGDPDETVEAYLRTVHQVQDAVDARRRAARRATARSTSWRVEIHDDRHQANAVLRYGEPGYVEITYRVTRPVDDPVLSVTFQDVRDYPLGGITSRFGGVTIDNTPGTHTARLALAPVLFTRGSYGVTVAIHDSRIQRYLDMRPRAATFMVDGPSVASREVSGHFVFPHQWQASAGRGRAEDARAPVSAAGDAAGRRPRPRRRPDAERRLRLAFVCNDYPCLRGRAERRHRHAHLRAGERGRVARPRRDRDRRRQVADRGRSQGHEAARRAGRNPAVEAGTPAAGVAGCAGPSPRTARCAGCTAPSPFDLVVFPDAYGEGLPVCPVARSRPSSCASAARPASISNGTDASPRRSARAWSFTSSAFPPSRASLTVCSSRPFAEFVSREWGLDFERFRFVRNPLDIVRFRPAEAPLSEAEPSSSSPDASSRSRASATWPRRFPPCCAPCPKARFMIVGNDTRTAPGRDLVSHAISRSACGTPGRCGSGRMA